MGVDKKGYKLEVYFGVVIMKVYRWDISSY